MKEIFTYNNKLTTSITENPGNLYPFLIFSFFLDKEKISYHRIYMKFQDVVNNVNSLMNVIFILIGFAGRYYNEYKMKEHIIHDNYLIYKEKIRINDFLKDEKSPISELDTYFIVLPNAKGYKLKIVTIELRCPETNIIVEKNQIRSNKPIIFDYSNNTIRILTPIFNENRVLLKDGSSVINGYNVTNFEDTNILIKNKLSLNYFENDMMEVNRVNIFGDYCTVDFEDGIFEGKDINVKARGLSKISLGKSTVKSIKVDTRLASVDCLNINSLTKI